MAYVTQVLYFFKVVPLSRPIQDRFTIAWDMRYKLALFQKLHAGSCLEMAVELVRCQLYRNRNTALGYKD